ncbi:Ice-structuring protein [Faecalibacterium sp. An121]|uniref:Ice-structuring protein n=1 Tax=Faecalibacterium sp. An121 TaxID=1965550 RepID=UPI000B3A73ED|nr:Ice-structuring protein [Faecalibacterium sp. An121]OUQ38599.1 Ice-structuring protein [Faecalibacterium sp. An121]
MRTYVTPEEHARIHRRRRRQALGLAMAVLICIGIFTVLGAGYRLVASLFDETEQMQEYEDKLEGLVLFDPLPFDGIENIDDLTLRQAAVWGCIYSIQETQGNFDNYAHDPVTEQLLLPAVDVDAYLARLVGPSFQLTHRSFDMDDMTIEFDEATQCYKIPITGGVGYYRADVVDLFKQDGKLHVTVGYIPMYAQGDLIGTMSDTPTKYMDYLFERTSGSWYLTGLTESATKPQEQAASSQANSVVMMEPDQLQEAILSGVDPDAVSSSSASSGQTASSPASSGVSSETPTGELARDGAASEETQTASSADASASQAA